MAKKISKGTPIKEMSGKKRTDISNEDVIKQEDEEGETTDSLRSEMDEGTKEEEPYEETGREKLVEDDEMEPWEEGFMEGAEGKGKLARCANCRKLLGTDQKKVFEREIKGERYWFCSEKCAKTGKSFKE